MRRRRRRRRLGFREQRQRQGQGGVLGGGVEREEVVRRLIPCIREGGGEAPKQQIKQRARGQRNSS